MNLLQTVLAFIVALGVLVTIHELGHYLVARLCGVKVLRFSVGMGKVIFSRRLGRDQTEWAISMLPLGGYVKMLDARESDLKDLPVQDLQREFTRQSVWRRIAIVAAGPLANFLLAIALFAGLYVHGTPEPLPKLRAVPENTAAYQAGLRGGELVTAVNGEPVRIWSDLRWKLVQLVLEKKPVELEVNRSQADSARRTAPARVSLSLHGLTAQDLESDFLTRLGIELARPPATIGTVLPDGPGLRAGLQQGDLVQSVNGVPLADGLAFIDLVRASPGKLLNLHVLRGQQSFDLEVTPEAQTGSDGRSLGRIKVEVALTPEMIVASDPPWTALWRAGQRTWDTSVLTLKMLGKMVVGQVSWKNITGPITIADYAGQTARTGMVSYISFIAFISISLGVMNLLPIPVLDGGLLLYYSLEVLTGRPVSERFGEIAQRAGVGLLVTLMAVAVFNDIIRLIS
ncbi:MAG TPA: RIP metalloprotease RseP [Burkholderiaceae bacterium]|nr:RIP metalloprotease RseP [Burkholderiaceae bacterium]